MAAYIQISLFYNVGYPALRKPGENSVCVSQESSPHHDVCVCALLFERDFVIITEVGVPVPAEPHMPCAHRSPPFSDCIPIMHGLIICVCLLKLVVLLLSIRSNTKYMMILLYL